MNIKSLLIAAALACPVTSFALGPVTPLDRVIVKTEQFKGVSYLLERGLGRPLTANEKAQLARAIPNGPVDTDEDKLIIRVANGPQPKTFALYCVAGTGAGFWRGSLATCASLQTMKVYTLGTMGVGAVLEVSLNIFRLEVSFDSANYDSQFDPIPGSYALATGGLTLGVGGTGFLGFAGNKTLAGVGFNIGLGVDTGSVSGLFIQ